MRCYPHGPHKTVRFFVSCLMLLVEAGWVGRGSGGRWSDSWRLHRALCAMAWLWFPSDQRRLHHVEGLGASWCPGAWRGWEELGLGPLCLPTLHAWQVTSLGSPAPFTHKLRTRQRCLRSAPQAVLCCLLSCLLSCPKTPSQPGPCL